MNRDEVEINKKEKRTRVVILVNKGFIVFSRGTSFRERPKRKILSGQESQSEHRIRFILLACGNSHKITQGMDWTLFLLASLCLMMLRVRS